MKRLPRALLLVVGASLIACSLVVMPLKALGAPAGAAVVAASGTTAEAGTATQPLELTIAELAEANLGLNGVEVVFTGEAVGDVINADADHRWLTLVDKGASISVYLSAEDAAAVTHLGRAGEVGTTLRIQGIFKLDCEQHDGLTDVHAQTVEVIDPGSTTPSSFNLRELGIGGALIVVAAALIVLHARLRERSR